MHTRRLTLPGAGPVTPPASPWGVLSLWLYPPQEAPQWNKSTPGDGMHGEVMSFVQEARRRFPDHFKAGPVIEFGSFDMNGSVRDLFGDGVHYVGVDARPGKGVDVVSLSHQYVHPFGQVNVVISTEALEHDPHWEDTIRHALDLLRPGGVFVFTCAGPNRRPHEVECSPDGEHYRNLTPDDVRAVWSSWFTSKGIPFEPSPDRRLRVVRAGKDLQGFIRIPMG